MHLANIVGKIFQYKCKNIENKLTCFCKIKLEQKSQHLITYLKNAEFENKCFVYVNTLFVNYVGISDIKIRLA